ncbi:hypothetical protein D9613_012509 [Agrocybe pediades]|uniref:Uncharacterized protein n=1 Tax=Agrocybe pediades TaxID=84607 RepID=A0A8H4QRA1_9AGAR|nr:hypothetical protein D9613_012509 [Agrocybe pediades]
MFVVRTSAMVNRRISNDLKLIALRLKDRGRDTLEDILEIVGFSRKTFFRAQRQFRNTGSVAKTQAIGRERSRKALRADIQYLLRLSRHKPVLFLDEYQRLLHEKFKSVYYLFHFLQSIENSLVLDSA